MAVYVDENDIGLVVAGTDGRHAIMNLFVESVAGQILHEVQCDILIVPSHAQN
ncbi:universal stress protein [Brucella anthropi]|uniref:Universal stress protein n=1 Tax=Brucella anthropi TaxID=529 RepID=A0A6I0D638_BRUAN|nr:universal stress protein [Brucella anthropi]KAB2778253.1 universal stress protein [Brucella anthropi]